MPGSNLPMFLVLWTCCLEYDIHVRVQIGIYGMYDYRWYGRYGIDMNTESAILNTGCTVQYDGETEQKVFTVFCFELVPFSVRSVPHPPRT